MYMNNDQDAFSLNGTYDSEKDEGMKTTSYSGSLTYTFQGKLDLSMGYNIAFSEMEEGDDYTDLKGKSYGIGWNYHIKNRLPFNILIGGAYETGTIKSDYFDDLDVDISMDGSTFFGGAYKTVITK